MILADTLRDRVDDVIAEMERQFGVISPRMADLVEGALRGDTTAYANLQSVGRQVLAPMIDYYGVATGALAADWYDLNRGLAKVGGPWGGAITQTPNIDTGPMIGGAVKDFVTVESVLSGMFAGMDLRVRQASNGTIMDSTLRDPKATGWGRSTSAKCCEFCAMLAARGAVYRTQHTATFSPHTNCHCQAIPAWGGSTESMRSREDTIATRRNLSDQQRAKQNKQARKWIDANQESLGLL